jgi:hypothetical protein
MCAVGLAGATVLINKVWTQYSTSPTITSIESTHFPIWNIPYPAVTVCQVNKVHLSAAVALYKEEYVLFFFFNFPMYLQSVEIHSANVVLGGEGR